LLITDDLDQGDPLDESWLAGLIEAEFALKRTAEATWPKITDFDRLEKVFMILEQQGIIALHCAGYTQSDGFEDAYEVYMDGGGADSDYTGHCFYTEQDQEEALEEGGGLFIGFGHFSGSDKQGAKVGELLRVGLEAEGFIVDWDGTINSRLHIQNFRWQRRSP
jgi:hypothetical protein